MFFNAILKAVGKTLHQLKSLIHAVYGLEDSEREAEVCKGLGSGSEKCQLPSDKFLGADVGLKIWLFLPPRVRAPGRVQCSESPVSGPWLLVFVDLSNNIFHSDLIRIWISHKSILLQARCLPNKEKNLQNLP